MNTIQTPKHNPATNETQTDFSATRTDCEMYRIWKKQWFNPEDRHKYKMVVKAGFHLLSNQEPYFSITGQTWRQLKNGRWVDDCGGCIHDLIGKKLPFLKPLTPFHLRGQISCLPIHYIENSLYFINSFYGFGRWGGDTERERFSHLNAFKENILFGEHPEDDWLKIPHWNQHPNSDGQGGIAASHYTIGWKEKYLKEKMTIFLEERKPFLKEKMTEVMTAFNIPSIPLIVKEEPLLNRKGEPHKDGGTYKRYQPLFDLESPTQTVKAQPFNKQIIQLID